MAVDKENSKVSMSLKDYEELSSYEKAYKELIRELKGLAYIDGMNSESATIVIQKKKVSSLFIHTPKGIAN